MKQWYYAKNGQSHGPVDRETIQNLFDKHEIAASDLVWEEGMPEWVSAGSAFQATGSVTAKIEAPHPPVSPEVPAQPLPDYGNLLCWGVALTIIPYVNTVVLIVLAIFICLEISAAQREINAGRFKSSTYGNLHPVVGFLLVFCCGLFLYPFLMHWRNQSGYFKPQPHAVWFSIVVFVLAIIVGISVFVLFSSLGMLAQHPH
ncbi:MAG: DUF4339 domain-containing protein [Verrucomicrobiales bacterium]|jgi:hypothetical protein|nr:DUF4339 domain-containing protein [Verrucomicrobiales bacterium]